MTYPIQGTTDVTHNPPAVLTTGSTISPATIEALGQQMIQAVVNAVLSIISGGLLGSSAGTNSNQAAGLFGNIFTNMFSLFGVSGAGNALTGNNSLSTHPASFNVTSFWTNIVNNILNALVTGTGAQSVIDAIINGLTGGSSTGNPLTSVTSELQSLISAITGSGSGVTGVSGLGTWFTDLLSLLGNPLGLGSGNPTSTSSFGIPLFQDLITSQNQITCGTTNFNSGLGAGTSTNSAINELLQSFENLLQPNSSPIFTFLGGVGAATTNNGDGTATATTGSGLVDNGDGTFSVPIQLGSTLSTLLTDMGDGTLLNTPDILQNLAGLVGTLFGTNSSLQAIVDGIFNASNGGSMTGNSALTVLESLLNIPFGNVLGTLGPANLGGSVQAMLDNVYQGFTGLSTTGNSLANIATASANVSNTASNAQGMAQSNTVFISQQSVTKQSYLSIDPTSDVVFPLTNITGSSPSVLTVNSNSSVMGMVGTPHGGTKKSIIWLGQNTSNVSSIVLNLYKMNTSTGALTKLFTSPNIISQVPNSLSWNYYDLPSANFVNTNQGDWYAVEMQTQGTGTHQITGLPNHWLPANGNVNPQQLAATRTGTVAFDAVGGGYTNNTASSSTINGSWSHTATAGAAVIVSVSTTINNVGFSSFTRSATYGGNAMTSLGVINDANATFGWVQLFAITNVAGGASTVAISISGGGSTIEDVIANSVSYTGCGGFGTVVTNQAQSTSASSGTITVTTGGMVCALIGAGNLGGSAALSSFAGGTARYNTQVTGTNQLAAIFGDSTSSANFTATVAPSLDWGTIGVPLIASVPSAPSTISSPTYSANVPWFGLGGSAPFVPPVPQVTEFYTAGTATYTVPSQFVVSGYKFDIVLVGAGSGGGEADTGGKGGGIAGSWNAVTLTYGTDIPLTTTTFSVTVGAGGAGVPAGSGVGNGQNGGSSSVTITGWSTGTITAAGGIGNSTSTVDGASPGNETFNSTLYYGGAVQQSQGANGNAPGGGGEANTLFGPPGGRGAPGAVWITAYS